MVLVKKTLATQFGFNIDLSDVPTQLISDFNEINPIISVGTVH